ncbi:MAG: acyltransferase 3 [Mycobacterium sp.]|nr:acyltransferase 3 [Mycobacterium sp.]
MRTDLGPAPVLSTGAGGPTPLPRATRFDGLEAVRALAAIAVVVTHVAFQTGSTLDGMFAGLLARLDAGVAFFFVLSGFLLFLPYVRRRLADAPPPSSRAYLWRRAIRILPAYWFAVIACFLLFPENAGVTVADWVRHALLVQGYQPGTLRPGLTQTWSLATEAAFYVALPALAWLVLGRRRTARDLRRPLAVLAGLVLFSVLWLIGSRLVDPEGTWPSGSWLPGTIGWFAAGMALATLRAWYEVHSMGPGRWLLDVARAPGSCWLLAVLLMLIATTPVAGPRLLLPTTGWEMVWKHLLYGAAAFLAVLPLTLVDARTSRPTAVLSGRLSAALGHISYSIFLWHLLVLQLVYRFTDLTLFGGQFWRALGLTLAGSLVVAAVSYLVVERPAMRLKGLVPDRSTPTAATTQASASTEAIEAPVSPAP